jgi:hypothetical protein
MKPASLRITTLLYILLNPYMSQCTAGLSAFPVCIKCKSAWQRGSCTMCTTPSALEAVTTNWVYLWCAALEAVTLTGFYTHVVCSPGGSYTNWLPSPCGVQPQRQLH